ncbi:hypothetical protein ROZALSC1DRAFT_25795, partial [Rozella allomycis CSF55]
AYLKNRVRKRSRKIANQTSESMGLEKMLMLEQSVAGMDNEVDASQNVADVRAFNQKDVFDSIAAAGMDNKVDASQNVADVRAFNQKDVFDSIAAAGMDNEVDASQKAADVRVPESIAREDADVRAVVQNHEVNVVSKDAGVFQTGLDTEYLQISQNSFDKKISRTKRPRKINLAMKLANEKFKAQNHGPMDALSRQIIMSRLIKESNEEIQPSSTMLVL